LDRHFLKVEIEERKRSEVFGWLELRRMNRVRAVTKPVQNERFFKGYAKPGPSPEPDHQPPPPEPEETLDSISGFFWLYQLRKGHRFSTDDVLTAWYGTTWCPSVRSILDLGSGIGTVASIAAWRCPGAKVVTVEAQAESVRLARKSAAQNRLTDRMDIREGDFRNPEMLRADERFDLVLGSPPYWPLEDGIQSEHSQKVACRFEVRGDVADYCRVAAAHLDWGGVFACVFPVRPAGQLEKIKAAARAAELTIVRWRPVVLREGDGPLLGLFVMTRSDHLPESFRDQTWVEPPLIIRASNGEVHPEYQAVKLAFGFRP
jgi:tRNA1(Val) A37 N6-methylase TrmN6